MMPQLDFDTYLGQLVWLVIVFSVLYAFSSWYVVPSMRRILESRSSKLSTLRAAGRDLQERIDVLDKGCGKIRNQMAVMASREKSEKMEKLLAELNVAKEQVMHFAMDEVRKVEEILAVEYKEASVSLPAIAGNLAVQIGERLYR